VWLTSALSTSLKNSGGAFASDPSLAEDAYGNAFAVARDNFNALWLNYCNAQSQSWQGWVFAGGVVAGKPAIAVSGSTAYIAARDSSNAYWLRSYSRASGFGTWTSLGGVFATDPVMASTSAGIFLAGRDNFGAIWAAARTTSFGGWYLGGAVAQGQPSLAVGTDGNAYIAIRDASNAVWMGSFNGSMWNTWQPGGGVIATDPLAARVGTQINVSALTSLGAVWYNRFTQGTANNWVGWSYTGGVLMDATPAGGDAQFFIAGRDGSNKLWWYETPGRAWVPLGYQGLAAGPLSAGPR
jgi:hypothetical protein